LTQKLGAYSARHVKISTGDMAHAKYLLTECVEKEIPGYCMQKSSLPILRVEYRGSMYEGPKPEAADEADLMVVIKATEAEVAIVEAVVPGYAFLRVRWQQSSSFLLPASFFLEKKSVLYHILSVIPGFEISFLELDFQRRFSSSQYTL